MKKITRFDCAAYVCHDGASGDYEFGFRAIDMGNVPVPSTPIRVIPGRSAVGINENRPGVGRNGGNCDVPLPPEIDGFFRARLERQRDKAKHDGENPSHGGEATRWCAR
jgi:hypothetical protein